MADARNIEKILAKVVSDVQKELQINLPRKVGIIAKNHFTDNFRQGGFVDNGLRPWQVTKRQQAGGKREPTFTAQRPTRDKGYSPSLQSHPAKTGTRLLIYFNYIIICVEYGKKTLPLQKVFKPIL